MKKLFNLSLLASLAACVPGGQLPGHSAASVVSGDAGAADSGESHVITTDPPGPQPDPSPYCDTQVYAEGDTAVCDTLFIGRHASNPTRRQLLDRCGQPFIYRGSEFVVALGARHDGNWQYVADQIDLAGLNAIRLLPYLHPDDPNRAAGSDIDDLLTRLGEKNIVAWISPTAGGQGSGGGADEGSHYDWYYQWFKDNMAMLLKHKDHIVIDAFLEPDFNDCAGRWRENATEGVRQLRGIWVDGENYQGPLSVMGNEYGRDLRCDLSESGAAVAAVDPLKQTMLGWQAYWGTDGYWQSDEAQDMTLKEGVQRVLDQQDYPIQIGNVYLPDRMKTSQPVDYSIVMKAAEGVGMTGGKTGYLWWFFWTPWSVEGGESDLMQDDNTGHISGMKPRGVDVLVENEYAIQKVAKKACIPR